MPNYRRRFVPGGTYFFTVCLADRGDWLLFDQVDDLKDAWRSVAAEAPFRTEEAVILPDHLHCIWTLPEGDADYANRWQKIKARFSRRCAARPVRASLARKGERGIWQRRFWEHEIRDAADFEAHRQYCWTNPVRHGFVERPEDWPFSSVHFRRLGASHRLDMVGCSHPTNDAAPLPCYASLTSTGGRAR